MEKINLTDVISIDSLQEIQDAFSDATGLAAITVDTEGSVTNPSNFTDFCMKYTRGTKKGLELCEQCDLKGGKMSLNTGKAAVYRCHGNLVDMAVPIIISGQHVGSVIGGQVLPDKPDETKFRKIAVDLGINPDEYINALHKVPILPETRIKSAAKLLEITIGKICETANDSYVFRDRHEKISKCSDDIKDKIEEFYKILLFLNSNQSELIEEIENINNLLGEINNIVKSVSSIADETQMISFNASIEAARAGEYGKSFTVISNEIRRLSEQSKKTVSNIQGFTMNIEEAINKTNIQSKNCIDSIKKEMQDLNDIKVMVENINSLSND